MTVTYIPLKDGITQICDLGRYQQYLKIDQALTNAGYKNGKQVICFQNSLFVRTVEINRIRQVIDTV